LNESKITDEIVKNTIGSVLKHKDDIEFVRSKTVQEFLYPDKETVDSGSDVDMP